LLDDLWTNALVVYGLFMAESAWAGALQVTMFALFMSLCWSPVAATQFTAYTAMMNFANLMGAKQAASIESAFGIVNSHVALGCLQLALVAVAFAIDPDESRRRLEEPVKSGEAPPRPAREIDTGLPFPPDPPPRC
jgi:hypothetical protein